MYERFLIETQVSSCESILDIGATSDQTYRTSNYLEAWYPFKHKITAAGVSDASFLEVMYPGMRFVFADGLLLPFSDRSFDVVHSSAVIEHVGIVENQSRFLRECARVANRAFFLTTPNRWFPIEFHTVLPLVHWLPAPIFRAILRASGLHFFARQENLNLLSSVKLRGIAQSVPGFQTRLVGLRLAGWVSNLLLIGLRTD
jgi:SAM-dependent methyltransferase